MVKGKVKNPVKQYLPMKPIKRGSKVWALGCSCCGYMFDIYMQVYCGKVANTVEHGLVFRVVTDLCKPHLPNGNNHVVYVDNFTSLPLSRHLESVGVSCVGTIRNNKKEYPLQLKDPALVKQLIHGEFHTATVGLQVISVCGETLK